MLNHVNNSKAISGTYRGDPVTHYLNMQSGLNVIVSPAGEYIRSWRLAGQQLQNVLRTGALQ
jgi:hypothetical protein